MYSYFIKNPTLILLNIVAVKNPSYNTHSLEHRHDRFREWRVVIACAAKWGPGVGVFVC
jgi:hypothetical protein